jgi:DNA repair protein RadC
MELELWKPLDSPNLPEKPALREKMQEKGIRALSDMELIAVLLRVGIADIPVLKLAQEVLKVLEKVTDGNDLIDKLVHIPGMGRSKTAAVTAALELGRRKFGPRGTVIHSPADIYPLVSHFSAKKQEYFLCVSLNGAHEVIEVRVVTIGILNRTVVHPREVFADALSDRAAAVIVCHNHPSGQREPSVNDIDITRRIKEAGDILGIPLLDHIIITAGGYYSFIENGLFKI